MKVLETDGVFGRRAGLRQNPDFSGCASRKIWIPRFPRLADGYLEEASGFPDLLMVISGSHWFPRVAYGYLEEAGGLPDLLMVISGKQVVSRVCCWSCWGNPRFPSFV